MARGLIIAATIVDVAIAVLLVAVSGFIIGSGPESVRVGSWGQAVFFAAVLGCLAAPAVGFAMQSMRRPAGGILIAWLPPLVGLLALAVPPNY